MQPGTSKLTKIKWLSVGSKFKTEFKGILFNWGVWQAKMATQVSSDLKSIKHDNYFEKQNSNNNKDNKNV